MESRGKNVNKTNQVYFENLDALRFFSFLSVFFFLSFYTDVLDVRNSKVYSLIKYYVLGNASIGVNFFFVLSGFLITYLLLLEKDSTGKINLSNFYVKRILRIWPLYYLCVLIGFIFVPYVKNLIGSPEVQDANLVSYIFFYNNLLIPINEKLVNSSVLSILWSIAVEEQFYLIWPIIIAFIPLKKLPSVFLTIIFLTLVFRAIYSDYWNREFHTFSCIGDMTIGGLGAYLITFNKRFKEYIIHLKKELIIIIYILFIFIYLFRYIFYKIPVIDIFERGIVACVFLFIILEQNYSINSLFKFGKLKRISKLGVITYGLYCFHQIALIITTQISLKLKLNDSLFDIFVIQSFIGLTLCLLFSILSYKFFEQPILRYKRYFNF